MYQQTRTDNGSYPSYSAQQFKPRGYPPAADKVIFMYVFALNNPYLMTMFITYNCKQRFAVSAPSFSPYYNTAPAHGTRMSNADQTQSFMKFTGDGGSQQPPAASNMQRIGNPVTTPNSRTFIPTNSTNRGLSSNSTTFKPRTNLNSTSTTFRPQRTANATRSWNGHTIVHAHYDTITHDASNSFHLQPKLLPCRAMHPRGSQATLVPWW